MFKSDAQVVEEFQYHITRRHFLTQASLGLGGMALAAIGNPGALQAANRRSAFEGILDSSHFLPRARRIIYLHQSGAPSQLDLFDYKPSLNERNGEELPESVRSGQRLTGMTANQGSLPLVGSIFKFRQFGKSGAWFSDLLPHMASIADEFCTIKSMFTEAINHDPAVTFFQTGSQQPGRPSMGAWLSYGLGSMNRNLPTFCVLLSKGRNGDQPLYARLWGNGFLHSLHQGVQFRPGKDPVLYLNDPPGLAGLSRRRMLDHLRQLNLMMAKRIADPEITARIAQYEMAYRMQTSVPEAMHLDNEPDWIFDLYGPNARKPGTYAANCLLARRLAERDVRFIQLYHMGWDQHGNLPEQIQKQCQDVDQPTTALIKDLKMRGLLDDTLVVWGGEFGRTNYSQGKLSETNYGRDHHPRCFSILMAGGGVKAGLTYGETDEFGYNIVKDPVHVHDLQATILFLLGIDHKKLTFKHQGRRYRLTDVHGKIVHSLVA